MDEIQTLVKELHAPAYKSKQQRRVFTTGIDDCWGLDLMQMSTFAAVNDGFKFVMVVEDIFSRYCWCVPLKAKNAVETWNAFSGVLAKVEEPPLRLWTDKGGEFYSDLWKKNLKPLKILHYTTFSPVGVSSVERLIRTLKNKMWPKMEEAGSYRWLDILPEVVRDYNHTVHSALKMTPTQARDVSNEVALWRHQYAEPRYETTPAPKLKVGDWVRVSIVKGVFERGFHPNWSYQAFQVTKVIDGDPVLYKVAERDGAEVDGTFYESELQKTAVPDVGFVDVVETDKKKKLSKVTWRGVPHKFDQWVPTRELQHLGAR